MSTAESFASILTAVVPQKNGGMDFRRYPKGWNSPSKRLEFDDVARALLANSEAVCRHLFPAGVRRGSEFVVGDLTGAKGESLSINLRDGVWADFSTGEGGADLIALWAARHGLKQGEAKGEAESFLGLTDGSSVTSSVTRIPTAHPAGSRQAAPVAQEDDANWWKKVSRSGSWEYRDRNGNVWGNVFRWDSPGRAKVIRPFDPKIRSYAAPKGPRPLFNLLAVMASTGHVVLVEGEKTADAVKAAGFVATTIFGGSNATGMADWSPLAGRDVTIWPDNDPAGQKFAKSAIEKLQEAGAASVRVCPIPDGSPEKWDADDATLEERQAIIAAGMASRPVFKPLDVYDFDADRQTIGEAPARSWVVLGAIPAAVPFIIYGAAGCGKSMAVLDLCLKVATRGQAGLVDPQTFLGQVPAEAAGAAVYLTIEDDRAEIHRRLNRLDPGRTRKSAPLSFIPVLDLPGFDPVIIRTENRIASLTRFAEEGGGLEDLLTKLKGRWGVPVKLLVMDPAGELVEGNEDSSETIKPLMRRLREISSQHDCAIGLVGHVAKGELNTERMKASGMRGSGAWTAGARMAFGLWRPDDETAKRELRKLGLPLTSVNAYRVVFGHMTKENHGGGHRGRLTYLQDEKTGLLHDVTARIRSEAASEAENAPALLLDAVKEAAELGQPYRIDGASGLYKLRATLPAPLNGFGEKKLRGIGNALLEAGKIQKCRGKGSTLPVLLDVPGGPFAIGVGDIATGSLEELRKKRDNFGGEE